MRRPNSNHYDREDKIYNSIPTTAVQMQINIAYDKNSEHSFYLQLS